MFKMFEYGSNNTVILENLMTRSALSPNVLKLDLAECVTYKHLANRCNTVYHCRKSSNYL